MANALSGRWGMRPNEPVEVVWPGDLQITLPEEGSSMKVEPAPCSHHRL